MEAVNGQPTSTGQASPPLESIVGWTWRDRMRYAWHRLRAVVEEMNYAARQIADPRTRLPR
jgi:hypothetical protein